MKDEAVASFNRWRVFASAWVRSGRALTMLAPSIDAMVADLTIVSHFAVESSGAYMV